MTLARDIAPRHLQTPGVAIASGGRSGQSRVRLELQQRPLTRPYLAYARAFSAVSQRLHDTGR